MIQYWAGMMFKPDYIKAIQAKRTAYAVLFACIMN
ncbi:hypothetical protein CLV59_101871 [Chitinophaga dinghuensis]|uniref:Uncharacterized protein n=1 Tax=Chitinophaga dinghuensis TaxID=1539050 RepID=A0A327WFE7_9BACT|nr:hypothetical protein CLV59_101871 [Chitinophaga dinghuensis]